MRIVSYLLVAALALASAACSTTPKEKAAPQALFKRSSVLSFRLSHSRKAMVSEGA